MLYVQQSLGPDEEILMGARFHWMYTVKAISWILFGIAAGIAVGYGAIWWEVTSHIRSIYGSELPEHLFQQAWDQTVDKMGGYMNILWSLDPALRLGILGFFVFGLFLFAHMMIVRATTEIAITSERLIYKRGLIARHVGELSVDRIEGVSVIQGILGRLFGYGEVSIRGMGVGEVVLPPIEAPIVFRRMVSEAKSMEEKGSVSQQIEEF